MALDRENTFSNAERLLKQGKIAQALDECKRLAEDAPKDLLMLNRLGDILARSNRGADAIVYYSMIAEQFSTSGFYPKAIAILKKIIRVDPGHLASVVRLGELNLKQKLPGEARTWLLQAAEGYVRGRDFTKAREVYEKLVAAEPDSVVHVVRLAEARAAEGDAGRAGSDLIALGKRMLAGGRAEDAERTFKRASELLPGSAEPLVGLARFHAAAGRREEALRLADEARQKAEGAGAAAADLLQLFEQLGDSERVARLLADPLADAINDETIEQLFRTALAGGGADAVWTQVLPLLERWARAGQIDRSVRVLERIARIEESGHLRALEQLVEMRKAEGNRAAVARALERLIRAHQAKGETAKLAPHLEALKQFDPGSPLLFLGRTAAEPPAAARAATAPEAEAPAVSELEVPAVPIGPADLEFVSGNLTEAEVFEKYGLHREALQQLRQITSRFPGHVVSQEKLVGFLRTQTDRAGLRDGLVALALAKRAAGDTEGARRAAREAASTAAIDRSVRAVLERFALLPVEEPGQAPATAPTPAAAPSPAPNAAAPPMPKSTPAAASPQKPPPPAVNQPEPEEMEILFDDVEEMTEGVSVGNETIEEIEFYLSQGMQQDALNRIAEARRAGAESGPLDALEARARAATVSADATAGGGNDRLDEEDLSSITAALEAEYGTDRVPDLAEPAPEPESEQSVEEVFESFKEQVNASVDVGDYRTHYDLGIAYKEMGLSDDALAEFHIASRTPELYREACSMLGLCHWDRGETEEAIRWYRAALDAPGGEEDRLSGLRYDLADRLEQTGDVRGAYDQFTQVLREEPGYRDVDRRLAALRAKLGL